MKKFIILNSKNEPHRLNSGRFPGVGKLPTFFRGIFLPSTANKSILSDFPFPENRRFSAPLSFLRRGAGVR